MIDDFKPADRRPKSLQAALSDLPERPTPNTSQNFQTPDQAAAVDDLSVPAATLTPETEASAPKTPQKKSWRNKLALHWPPGKKEYIVLGVAILVLAAGGVGIWQLTKPAPKPVVAAIKRPVVKVAPKPTTIASNLSGLQVDPSLNALPVTGVMIENSDDARPQAGLSQAGVVFEAVAEGGVTRFLALYQDQQPSNVGPIRSARPYYVQWAFGFDAGYAHVGGSPDAISDIRSWGVRDLDQFYNSGSYHRITARQAPHNVYSGVPTLVQLEQAKGYTSSTFTSWARKKDTPGAQPTARTINLTLSGPDYNVKYLYNVKTDSYDRSEGGAAQTDANTNAQLSPKVVIAMIVPESRGALDASGAYYSNYQSIGSGTVDVFEDGMLTTGTWTKSANNAPLTFTDASGQPIKLNAGQAWITAISSAVGVSYAP